MSVTTVAETQILATQKTLLENQALILKNQEEIKRNQLTLNAIVKNQVDSIGCFAETSTPSQPPSPILP
jgi:hypothetical protein